METPAAPIAQYRYHRSTARSDRADVTAKTTRSEATPYHTSSQSFSDWYAARVEPASCSSVPRIGARNLFFAALIVSVAAFVARVQGGVQPVDDVSQLLNREFGIIAALLLMAACMLLQGVLRQRYTILVSEEGIRRYGGRRVRFFAWDQIHRVNVHQGRRIVNVKIKPKGLIRSTVSFDSRFNGDPDFVLDALKSHCDFIISKSAR